MENIMNKLHTTMTETSHMTSSTHFDFFFHKFINLLMINGKKSQASKIFFNVLLLLKKKIQKDSRKKSPSTTNPKEITTHFTLLHLLSRALENVTPSLEVRKVRVAGSTYIVPAVISKKKQETLALKWLIESAKKRQKNSKSNFSTCLADEILDASRKTGQARQKRDELHRLAQMNRAYVRYRWW